MWVSVSSEVAHIGIDTNRFKTFEHGCDKLFFIDCSLFAVNQLYFNTIHQAVYVYRWDIFVIKRIEDAFA